MPAANLWAPATVEDVCTRLEHKVCEALTSDKSADPFRGLDRQDNEDLARLWQDHAFEAQGLRARLIAFADNCAASAKVKQTLSMTRWKDEGKKRRTAEHAASREMDGAAAKQENEENLRKAKTRLQVIHEFNQEFVHTYTGARSVVLRKRDLHTWWPTGFKEIYNELVVDRIHPKTGPVWRPAGEIWLASDLRQLALHGIICDPELKSGLIETTVGGRKAQAFNTWDGLQIVPAAGDWAPMAEVLTKIFPEPVMHDWAMRWMARTVQQPWRHAETSLVLTGPHGAGKSTLAEFFKRVFGPRHCGVYDDAGAVFGRFNDHLRDLVVLVAEEAFFHGDPRNFAKLKNMITNNMLSLEVKNGARFTAANRLSTIIISNDEFVVQTAAGDRRYAVSKVLQWKQNDNVYWTSFYEHMERGGWAAFLDHLLKLDITGFNHRLPPETEALREQRQFTRVNTLDDWWETILRRGHIYRSELGLVTTFHEWPLGTSTPLIAKSFKQWIADRRLGRHEIKTEHQLGAFLTRKVGLIASRLTDAPIDEIRGEHGGEVVTQHRVHGYRLRGLDEMRQEHDERMGEVTAWNPDNPDSELPLSPGTEEQPDHDEEPDHE